MAKAMGSYKTWKLDSNGPGEVEMVEREGGDWVGCGENRDTLHLEIRSLEASSHLLSN